MQQESPIRMMMIDDRSITSDLDRAGYRKMGVHVKTVPDFDAAEKLLSQGNIDLIVINMDYEGVDACTATQHIKQNPSTEHLPVVVTSVRSAAKIRKQALAAGADLFVEQPLPRQYFIEKLKHLLEQSIRDNERVALGTDVSMTHGDITEKAPLGDLSDTGLLFITETYLAPGTEVELKLLLPSIKRPLSISGEVVRRVSPSGHHPEQLTGLGIKFVTFKGESKIQLERYVAKTSDVDQKLRYFL